MEQKSQIYHNGEIRITMESNAITAANRNYSRNNNRSVINRSHTEPIAE
jgi:hypothetical protein